MHIDQPVIPSISSDQLRQKIRRYYLEDETRVIRELIDGAAITDQQRAEVSSMAAELVSKVRASGSPSMMENFLAEYGLTTREGVALMCLAEALLREGASVIINGRDEKRVGQAADDLKPLGDIGQCQSWALRVKAARKGNGPPKSRRIVAFQMLDIIQKPVDIDRTLVKGRQRTVGVDQKI